MSEVNKQPDANGNSKNDPQRTRAEVSRANALHSTGPRTPEGKANSKLNAVKHALTAQTIMGSETELVAYHHLSSELMADFAPVGAFEKRLVQSLADAQWQLDRSRTIEHNIYFASAARRIDRDADPANFDSNWADAQANAFLENAKQLDLMSRYGSRYHRQVLQIHATLAKVQKERRNSGYTRHHERKRKHNEAFSRHQQAAATGRPTNSTEPRAL